MSNPKLLENIGNGSYSDLTLLDLVALRVYTDMNFIEADTWEKHAVFSYEVAEIFLKERNRRNDKR